MNLSTKKYRDLTVLVADDSVFIRSLYRSMLMQIGISKISEASDGSEVIELLDTKPFDLVMLDWVMPSMSGRRTLQFIRRPEFAPMCTVPIIVITGQASRQNCLRAAQYGADAVIGKPFSINTLQERIECVLSPNRRIVRTNTYMGPNWFDPTRLSSDVEQQFAWKAVYDLSSEVELVDPGRKERMAPAFPTVSAPAALGSNSLPESNARSDDSGFVLDI